MGDNDNEILKQIKDLTSQQTSLANKVLALKRQLVGKSANPNNLDNSNATNTSTATATTMIINEPKRGRGRPKKNTTVTSSIITESSYSPMSPMSPMSSVEDVPYDMATKATNIYRYGNTRETIKDSPPTNPNLVYVIEDDDLFIRDNNGMLYNIESREVIGWYNPYSVGSSVKWLYR